MRGQRCVDREPFSALVANEGPLSRVRLADVTLKEERILKSFTVMGAFMRVGDDVARSVNPRHVSFHSVTSLESFFAVGTGVCSLPRVSCPVIL